MNTKDQKPRASSCHVGRPRKARGLQAKHFNLSLQINFCGVVVIQLHHVTVLATTLFHHTPSPTLTSSRRRSPSRNLVLDRRMLSITCVIEEEGEIVNKSSECLKN